MRRPFERIACLSALLIVSAGAAPAAGVAQETRKTVSEAERAATAEALAPTKRRRPVIVIVGDNHGAETTDFIIPYATLMEADVADVYPVSTGPGPLRLTPALSVKTERTIDDFDRLFPDGADYVIVPAMHRAKNKQLTAWISAQAGKGAIIAGICGGAQTLAHAGLLDGRKATGHWHDIKRLRRIAPTMQWVRNRRFVIDRGVVTTTGVTASLPFSLALVEAIGGRARADEVAATLGVASWRLEHDSAAFSLDRRSLLTAIANRLAFWRRELVAIRVADGVDEMSLAFAADAYSRTYRSRALAYSQGKMDVRSRRGLTIVSQRDAAKDKADYVLSPPSARAPARTLDAALAGIAERYGGKTADFVALQLEYPRKNVAETND